MICGFWLVNKGLGFGAWSLELWVKDLGFGCSDFEVWGPKP